MHGGEGGLSSQCIPGMHTAPQVCTPVLTQPHSRCVPAQTPVCASTCSVCSPCTVGVHVRVPQGHLGWCWSWTESPGSDHPGRHGGWGESALPPGVVLVMEQGPMAPVT